MNCDGKITRTILVAGLGSALSMSALFAYSVGYDHGIDAQRAASDTVPLTVIYSGNFDGDSFPYAMQYSPATRTLVVTAASPVIWR